MSGTVGEVILHAQSKECIAYVRVVIVVGKDEAYENGYALGQT
jgi:hypothetical protein